MEEPYSSQNRNQNPGGDLFQKVQNAINGANYEEIADLINASVDKALSAARQGFKTGQYTIEKEIKAAKIKAANVKTSVKDQKRKTMEQVDPLSLPAPIPKNPPGTYSAPLMIVGGVASLVLAVFSVSSLLVAVLSGLFELAGAVTTGFFALLGAFLTGKGMAVSKLVKRFKAYMKAVPGRHRVEIATLSQAVGRSEKKVSKDLDKMLKRGMLPQGHLSDDGKILLLSDVAYEGYLKEDAYRKQKEAEKAHWEQLMRDNPVYKEAYLVIAEGERALKEIKKANDVIPGMVVSAKLDRLEKVIRRIFQHIEEHPDKVMASRRFMRYYLPTTLKLVNTYCELDRQPMQGENVMKAKTEIETSLDTISSGFEKFADEFYEDTAMDVSADISVMKTMMAREGLTD